jgi:phosphoribosylamine---glycine ligase
MAALVVWEPIGLPVVFDGAFTAQDKQNLHYCELGVENGQFVTSGIYGWAMMATGVGASIEAARRHANRLADRVMILNVRCRRDIGDRLIAADFARVEALGFLDPE